MRQYCLILVLKHLKKLLTVKITTMILPSNMTELGNILVAKQLWETTTRHNEQELLEEERTIN